MCEVERVVAEVFTTPCIGIFSDGSDGVPAQVPWSTAVVRISRPPALRMRYISI